MGISAGDESDTEFQQMTNNGISDSDKDLLINDKQ